MTAASHRQDPPLAPAATSRGAEERAAASSGGYGNAGGVSRDEGSEAQAEEQGGPSPAEVMVEGAGADLAAIIARDQAAARARAAQKAARGELAPVGDYDLEQP